MSGRRATARARSLWRLSLRVVLAGLAVALTLTATPGVAVAGGTYYPSGRIDPLVDCVRKDSGGTYTVVLGYTNPGATTVVPLGSWNAISPAKADGGQPTTFRSGTQHGVLSVTLTSSEYLYGGPYWYLDGNMVFFGSIWNGSVPACPSGTQLPGDGNGTGIAIGLVLAAGVGVLVVRRVTRRAGRQPVDAGKPTDA
jgi:hypothetical protein